MLRMQIPRSHPQKIRSAFSTQLKPGKRVWTRTRPGDGQQTTDGCGSCVHRIVIMVEDAGAHHVQVLGSDVRFAAAHSTAGARSRESRGSRSPSSAEPRIGVSRSPSPPAAERSPSLPPSPPLLHPLSQTRPPRPPTPRCPGWRLGRPPPGPTSSRSLSRFRPQFFPLLTRSSWGQDPLSSCRLCHHLLLRGTWPPQGLSPGLSTRLSPKRRHDPTGPLAQTHGGFLQPLDVGTARAVPLLGRRRAARGPAGAGGPRHPLLLPPSLRP